MTSIRGHFWFKQRFMIEAIIGKKIEQTQDFTPAGERIPVTVINVGPCFVIQIKTEDNDGYKAVQLGFGQRKIKKNKKTILGQLKKAGIKEIPRFLKEIRINPNQNTDLSGIKMGDVIKVQDVFKVGDKIKVSGISKGKGFAGVVKRHHFAGGPKTHGQSDRWRAPGSIGQTTTPGRVYKGKRMAGHMGVEKVTIKNLEVVKINPEKNQLIIKGLVPGGKNSLLTIKKSNL